MYAKPSADRQQSFFFSLEDTLDRRHPLFALANAIRWETFEEAFAKLYSPDSGRPCKPVRLMVGLLILKHVRNLSDEGVVGQWSENNYYQHFCGNAQFTPAAPCDASELVRFRERIGEAGMELILRESIRVNGTGGKQRDIVLDTTVQEKDITFPTDAKLHRKIVAECHAIAGAEGIAQRQRYTRTLKRLAVDQRFRNHAKKAGRARRADRKLRTIAGRLVRELERNLPPQSPRNSRLALFKRVLAQRKGGSGKIYSLHEPEVQCIAKGKERKKYEFGNKVSIAYTKTTGVIVGAMSFRNPYDGDTLEPALAQHEALTGARARTATLDRGYRGRGEVGGTLIRIPGSGKPGRGRHATRGLRRGFRRRAAIEPVIGHLKADHRLGRNFLKGVAGDAVNVMLAAAAFNFKRFMNKWQRLLSIFMRALFRHILSPAACHHARAA